MNKQKVKDFVKKHKGVFIVVGTAIGSSVLTVVGIRGYGKYMFNKMYKPMPGLAPGTEYALKDLGKLGEDIIKNSSEFTEDSIACGGTLTIK